MILFFDTETTGLNRSTARIVQLAWILSNSNGSEVSRSSMIIKPSGYSIPESAAAIHNITTEYALENGVPLKKCLKQMAELVDDVKLLVAHNISYDSSILKEEFHRAGLNYPFGKTPVVCTMKSSTEYCELPKNSDIPGYKYPKLEELYRHLFGYDFLDAHDALADAEACKQCYFELVERNVLARFDDPDTHSANSKGDKIPNLPYTNSAPESGNYVPKVSIIDNLKIKDDKKLKPIAAESLQKENITELNNDTISHKSLKDKQHKPINEKALPTKEKTLSQEPQQRIATTATRPFEVIENTAYNSSNKKNKATRRIKVLAFKCPTCNIRSVDALEDEYYYRCPNCNQRIINLTPTNNPNPVIKFESIIEEITYFNGMLLEDRICHWCGRTGTTYQVSGPFKFICSYCSAKSN